MKRLLPSAAILGLACAAFMSCVSLAERQNLAVMYTELGNSLAEQGKWDKAGDAWSRALQLDPAQSIAGFNLMRALIESGKYGEAYGRGEAILKKDPDNATVIAVYAYALHKAGESERAIAAYRRAVELNAKDTDSLFNLAVLLEASDRVEDALLQYGEILLLDPEHEKANLRLGLLLLAQKKNDEALLPIEKYLARKPESLVALEALAAIRENMGLNAKAIETWQLISQKHPKEAAGWFNLARLQLTVADDAGGGIDALVTALDLGFKDMDALGKLMASESLADRGKVIDALVKKGIDPNTMKIETETTDASP